MWLLEAPARAHSTDSSWPPVLIFAVIVVVLGGLVASIMFLRRAREAANPRQRGEGP